MVNIFEKLRGNLVLFLESEKTRNLTLSEGTSIIAHQNIMMIMIKNKTDFFHVRSGMQREDFVLSAETISRIRHLRINKKRMRGKRGGKGKSKAMMRVMANSISLSLLNCRSLLKKSTELFEHLKREQIVILTETWLKKEDEIDVRCTEIYETFNMINRTREGSNRGGGVSILVRKNMNAEYEEVDIGDFTCTSMEWGVFRICVDSNLHLTIIGIYRPPSTSVTDFITDLTELFARVEHHANVFMLGDFNIPWNKKDDTGAQDLKATTYVLGLDQCVERATHIKGNILDHIYKKTTNSTKTLRTKVRELVTDHNLVTTYLERKTKMETTEKKEITLWKQIENHEKSLLEKLENIEWTQNINEDWRLFKSSIEDFRKEFIPTKNVKLRNIKDCSWFDEELKQARRQLRRFEKNVKRKRISLGAYRLLKKEYQQLLERKKRETISGEILEIGNDSKKLFEKVKQLTGSIKENPMPNGDDTEIANNFSSFFFEKIEKIRNQLEGHPKFSPEVTSGYELTNFDELSMEKVKKLIMSLKTKSCENDIVPTKILKKHLWLFLPSIHHLVNLSLQTGLFVETWKEAMRDH